MFEFNGKTYTMDQLEKNHEASEALLNQVLNMDDLPEETVRLAQENEQKHWFRLEKARDWATD